VTLRVPATAAVVAAITLLALSQDLGCALTSRGQAVDVQWYTPERMSASSAGQKLRDGGPGPKLQDGGCELRFGQVTSGADLGLRIAFGDGQHEVSYYEDRRWTERPAKYLEHAVERLLFEDSGFRRSLAPTAPRLDLELLDFEEVKSPTMHSARVAARVLVTVDREIVQRTVEVSRPVAGDRFDDFAASMAEALAEAARQISNVVVAATRCG
jgi:hypothetical protein